MKKLILIKLGGSLITNKSKPYSARYLVIKNLAYQIKKVLEEKPSFNLIIGNGGGSFPHYPAVKFKMKEGIKNEYQKLGFCEVQDRAAQLNRIIVREFLNAGIKAVSVNPSSMIIAKNGKIKKFFIEPIVNFLKLGLLPVIYGDIVFDEVLGAKIFSTEILLTELVKRLLKEGYQVEKIIHNGLTKGVLDDEGKLIKKISPQNFFLVKTFLKKAEGFDVTGGMIHKVKEALKLAKKYKIKTLIINGSLKKTILKEAILGKKVEGTLITN